MINIFLPGASPRRNRWTRSCSRRLNIADRLARVKTSIEGVHFSEHLKQTGESGRQDLRDSLDDTRRSRSRSRHAQYVHGLAAEPGGVNIPSMGSIVSHELGSRNDLPPYVCVPSQPNSLPGPAFLGSAYGPFSLGADPANGDFKVRDLNLPRRRG